MGNIAELMLEGVVCQLCSVFIGGGGPPDSLDRPCGYPRYCIDCGGDPECNGAVLKKVKKDGKAKNKKKERKK